MHRPCMLKTQSNNKESSWVFPSSSNPPLSYITAVQISFALYNQTRAYGSVSDLLLNVISQFENNSKGKTN